MRCEDLEDPTALSRDDIIILLIGSSGSGKSNFIDRLVGQPGYRAAWALDDGTSEVSATRILDDSQYGSDLVLVDTPGFSNSQKSDKEILQIISDWRLAIHKKHLSIRYVLLFHRIFDTHLSQSHLSMFKGICDSCGKRSGPKVTFVTTMWDEFPTGVGVNNEEKLIVNQFTPLFNEIATPRRFYNTSDSAQTILHDSLTSNKMVTHQLQQEKEKHRTLVKSEMSKILVDHHKLVEPAPTIADQKETEDEVGSETPDEVEQHSLGTMSCEDLPDPTALSNDDLIILIVGSTGSGKSNFIDTLVGQRGRRAGSSMQSCTSKVGATRIFDHPVYGNRIVLVDTPGFNDTSKSDIEILEIIAEWLTTIDQKCLSIRGILYLHRISDVRFSGSHILNFKVFSAMCGESIASNIAIITTMWDEFYSDAEIEKEQDLISNHWNTLLKHGAASQRFHNTYLSAQNIVENILQSHGPVRMQLQREMVDMSKDLCETLAGQILLPGESPENDSNEKLMEDEASDKGTVNSTRSGNSYTIRDATTTLRFGMRLSHTVSEKKKKKRRGSA